jgi:hypothetical protein
MSAGANGEATPSSRLQEAEKYVFLTKKYIYISTNFKILRQNGIQ